jgi:hypothetical protein
MEKLRQCKVSYEKEKQFYFHKWTEKGMTKLHGEDPQKDSTYVVTMAIVEDVKTGEVKYADADCVIFM